MSTKMRQLDEETLMSEDTQIGRIFRAVRRSPWSTLPEIHKMTADPVPSISAQLRHIRRVGFTVDKRLRSRGLYEFRIEGSASECR